LTLLGDEPFAGCRKFGKKRRGLERRIARTARVLGQSIANDAETDPIGVVHRAAAPRGPAVAVDPYDIDILGPDRDAFRENARAFVDQRIDHPLDDLVRSDWAAI